MAWYVVHAGRKTGVFSTWEAWHAQVDGFKGAWYKKFTRREEALAAFYGDKCEDKLSPILPESKPTMSAATSKDKIILVLGAIILVQVLFIVILACKLM